MDNSDHPAILSRRNMPQSNQERQSYISPRNRDSAISMSNAIRFTPRSPVYNQSHVINSTNQRAKPIIIRSPNRFNSHPDTPFFDTGQQMVQSAGKTQRGFTENGQRFPDEMIPFHGISTENENYGSQGFQNFSSLDVLSNTISHDANTAGGGTRYVDQINSYSGQTVRPTFATQNDQYESPNQYNSQDQYDLTIDGNNHGSDSDRESSLQIFEEEEETEMDETIGRLETVVNMLRNPSENPRLLERLDRLERNVLSALVVTNMMGANGIKNNAQSGNFRSIENLSNYVHNDLLTKNNDLLTKHSWRTGMSQGLTSTRDSLISVIEIQFNATKDHIETRLSLEEFTSSNTELKEHISAKISEISNNDSISPDLIDQIVNAVQNTIRGEIQTKSENKITPDLIGQIVNAVQNTIRSEIQTKPENQITPELIRSEVESSTNKIITTIGEKCVPVKFDYEHIKKDISRIISDQLQPVTDLIKSETSKTNVCIKNLSQSVSALHENVISINNTHSRYIRIINNNITELGRVITSVQTGLENLNLEIKEIKAASGAHNTKSRRARRNKSPSKSRANIPAVVNSNSLRPSLRNRKTLSNSDTFESITSPPPTHISSHHTKTLISSVISPNQPPSKPLPSIIPSNYASQKIITVPVSQNHSSSSSPIMVSTSHKTPPAIVPSSYKPSPDVVSVPQKIVISPISYVYSSIPSSVIITPSKGISPVKILTVNKKSPEIISPSRKNTPIVIYTSPNSVSASPNYSQPIPIIVKTTSPPAGATMTSRKIIPIVTPNINTIDVTTEMKFREKNTEKEKTNQPEHQEKINHSEKSVEIILKNDESPELERKNQEKIEKVSAQEKIKTEQVYVPPLDEIDLRKSDGGESDEKTSSNTSSVTPSLDNSSGQIKSNHKQEISDKKTKNETKPESDKSPKSDRKTKNESMDSELADKILARSLGEI